MELAEDAIADLVNIIQNPNLVAKYRRQIVTTLHTNRDTKGKRVIYLSGYVLEDQQLSVFLAATPLETQLIFMPMLTKILHSIEIRSSDSVDHYE